MSSRILGEGKLRTTYHHGMLRWILLLKVLSSFTLSSALSVISIKQQCKMTTLNRSTMCDGITDFSPSDTQHSRFSVLFSYHKANTIQMSVLIMLVDSISKLPLDSHLIDSAELSHLFDNLQEILRSTLNVLNDHLVEFDTKNASSVGKLKEHLLYVCSAFHMTTISFMYSPSPDW